MTAPLDLLVVGGGPAGLATAINAARAGLAVTVWEPRVGGNRTGIDKACGEGLMPGGLDALHDLGVDADGRTFVGIRYVAGDRSVEAEFRRGVGRGIRRTTLHAALLDKAGALGVVVEARRVIDVAARPDGLVDATSVEPAGDDPTTVRARHLVAADGLHSPVRRMLGLDVPSRHPKRHGLRAHVRTTPWTDHVEVHWAAGAEAYVTPVADDLVGIAVLTTTRGPYADQLAKFPALQARVAAAPVVTAAASPGALTADHPAGTSADPWATSVLGAGPLHQRARRRVHGPVLLVGDAGGYVDAITGEGISLALAQAQAAVAAIMSGDPQRYEGDWRRITRRYRLLTETLLAGTRLGPTRRAVVPLAQRLPGVFGAAVDVLARPA